MEFSEIHYSKLGKGESDLLCIQVSRGFTGSGEFGLGLILDDDNTILKVQKDGEIYGYYKDIIKPGMKIDSINGSLVGHGKINTTNILRKQKTNTYNIYLNKKNIHM